MCYLRISLMFSQIKQNFRGWSIFWYLGVIVTVISLLLSAATILSGSMGSIIPTLVLLIVLLYLFKRNVKDFFLG